MFRNVIFFLVLIYGFNIVKCSRENIHQMFYDSMDTSAACFRRLNGTHQFGCSSTRGGSVGVIYFIDNEKDVNAFLNNTISNSYMVVLNYTLFTSEVMDKLILQPSISGLLLTMSPSLKPPSHFSPDDVCPNSLTTKCDRSKPWNPFGNKFMHQNWPFPMFFVNDDQKIEKIRQCSSRFNHNLESGQQLCSLQMKSPMSAAVNSEVCLRRASQVGVRGLKYCDPMGDQNIVLPLGPSRKEDKVIIVSARLDTASLFDGIAPGAMTSVTSFVTLLAVAHVFSRLSYPATSKSVMFMLFNGEAYDNIGSSRVAYDMEQGQFIVSNTPLKLQQIMAFIDLSQIGSDPKLYLHSTNEAIKIVKNITEIGSIFSLNFEPSMGDLPPSSLQTFYSKRTDLPGVVVSNFDRQFINKYYNGLFDNSQTLGYSYGNGTISKQHLLQKNMAAVTSTLATVLYKMVTGNSTVNLPLTPDEIALVIDELLHCYLETRGCKYMKAVAEDIAGPPYSLYVSVQPSLNQITTITGYILAYLTAPQVALTKENCISETDSNSFSYIWANGLNMSGVCLNSTLKFTPAVSPAFTLEEYDWSSRKYSTWTESVWQDIGVEMFLKPSQTQELITLLTGVTTSLLSFGLVYWMNKQPIDVFVTPSPTSC